MINWRHWIHQHLTWLKDLAGDQRLSAISAQLFNHLWRKDNFTRPKSDVNWSRFTIQISCTESYEGKILDPQSWLKKQCPNCTVLFVAGLVFVGVSNVEQLTARGPPCLAQGKHWSSPYCAWFQWKIFSCQIHRPRNFQSAPTWSGRNFPLNPTNNRNKILIYFGRQVPAIKPPAFCVLRPFSQDATRSPQKLARPRWRSLHLGSFNGIVHWRKYRLPWFLSNAQSFFVSPAFWWTFFFRWLSVVQVIWIMASSRGWWCSKKFTLSSIHTYLRKWPSKWCSTNCRGKIL